MSVRILRQAGQEKKIEIHVEGPDFPDEAISEALKGIVAERYGTSMTMRLRTTLARDID